MSLVGIEIFALAAGLLPEASFVSLAHQILEIFALVLAPILVIYAAIAYRGQYESRSMPALIFLAVVLSLMSVLDALSGHAVTFKNSPQDLYAIGEDIVRVVGMVVLLLVLRSYVHSEIDLIKGGNWKPRDVLLHKTGKHGKK